MPEAPTRGVLVVTDDPALRAEAELAFPSDFDVAVCRDAREAWSDMDAWTPAVVIVDLLAGTAGGYALGRDMSQSPRLARVPILMLLDRHQDEWLARQAGASACKTKPIDAAELAATALSLVGDDAK
ncbi:MAG: response regulator [Actinomycetota bacterium]|nr:response regulator [Actinomycetota bacterium]